MRHYIFIFAILFSSNLNRIESKKTKKELHCDKETCKTGKSNEIIYKIIIKEYVLKIMFIRSEVASI